MKRILEALSDGDKSAREIREITGLDKAFVWRMLESLRELGRVHIGSYRLMTCRRMEEAVYTRGQGDDARPGMRRPPVGFRSSAHVDPYDEPQPVPFVRLGPWHDIIFTNGRVQATQKHRQEKAA